MSIEPFLPCPEADSPPFASASRETDSPQATSEKSRALSESVAQNPLQEFPEETAGISTEARDRKVRRDYSSSSTLLRNRPPLMNMPLSAGRHHSMATR